MIPLTENRRTGRRYLPCPLINRPVCQYKYVKPLYSVARHIPKLTNDGSEKRDYFAIKLTWNKKADATEAEYWNYAFNNKETDIIYISAKQNTPPADP